jgi:hypothetical protein
MLWTEKTGHEVHINGTRELSRNGSNGSLFSVQNVGGRAYSEIRRFAVVAEGQGNVICS